MIEIKEISKSFGTKKVIEGMNEQFKLGDLVLVQGRNGCGKSTLLKILAGLMKPTSGELIYSQQFNVGALIENPEFLEYKTLEYNLKFLYNLKNNYDEVEVQELCRKFSLDLESKQPVREFSVGMKQKAGVIQAVMEKQNLILLDEPTRGMDAESIVEFNELINYFVSKKDKIIIVAAHEGVDGLNFNKVVNM